MGVLFGLVLKISSSLQKNLHFLLRTSENVGLAAGVYAKSQQILPFMELEQ